MLSFADDMFVLVYLCVLVVICSCSCVCVCLYSPTSSPGPAFVCSFKSPFILTVLLVRMCLACVYTCIQVKFVCLWFGGEEAASMDWDPPSTDVCWG